MVQVLLYPGLGLWVFNAIFDMHRFF